MDEVVPRVGDSERRAVDARLQQAVGDGVLSLSEYEERAGLVWQARTVPDLEAVTRDLPRPAAQPPVHGGARLRPRRALAVMSGDELTGPVAPGQPVQAYAVMGGACVDLRRDDLPGEVRVRAVAVMGGVEIFVPRGTSVHVSGLSLMGGRSVTVDPPAPGGPVLHLDAFAVMGGVSVGHGRQPEPGPGGSVRPHSGDAKVDLHKPGAPVPQGSGPDGGPAGFGPPGSSMVRQRSRHRHRGRRLLAIVGLVALVGGASSVGSGRDAAVFGSRTVKVQPSQHKVDVATLFGSVKVIVPDGSLVTSSGVVVFGSSECRACDSPAVSGPAIEVHGVGGFGSIEIVTQSEANADQDTDGG